MPRQPRNLHFVATWHSSDNAIRKSTQHTTRLKCAAPATQNDDGHVQSAAPATKTATHLPKTSQKYCACYTKRLWTRYKTRPNVTKCHACHAKQSNTTCATSKCDPLARTYYRYGHTGLTRSPANGCERLGNIERPHPQPSGPRVKREPSLRIRE